MVTFLASLNNTTPFSPKVKQVGLCQDPPRKLLKSSQQNLTLLLILLLENASVAFVTHSWGFLLPLWPLMGLFFVYALMIHWVLCVHSRQSPSLSWASIHILLPQFWASLPDLLREPPHTSTVCLLTPLIQHVPSRPPFFLSTKSTPPPMFLISELKSTWTQAVSETTYTTPLTPLSPLSLTAQR